MKNYLSSSKGSCIRNIASLSRLVYYPTEMILAILYREVPHMLPAIYQPIPPDGSGEENF